MIKSVTIHSRENPDVQKEWWEDYEYHAHISEGQTFHVISVPYAHGRKLFTTLDNELALVVQSLLDTLQAKQDEGTDAN
jgi:hypothetical protein